MLFLCVFIFEIVTDTLAKGSSVASASDLAIWHSPSSLAECSRVGRYGLERDLEYCISGKAR